MDNRLNSVSVTPTIGRQTPRNEFGQVLKDTLQSAAAVGGSLVGALPGGAIVSAAVSSVTQLASQGQAASRSMAAVTTVGGAAQNIGSTQRSASVVDGGGTPADFGSMLSTMREEANKSMVMQMQMQQESREYNTITNVLKVRHDSAKAAINNIR